jgi:citrate lyase subunit beta/citryl-CoA lyase
MIVRPRRSLLYVPGANPRTIAKARTLPVDGVIFDLKDSVGPDGKADARAQVGGAIEAGGFGSREVVVRINAVYGEWWLDDLTMAARVKPDAVLIPRVTGVRVLQDVASRLLDISADHSIRVWAMMETPLSILYAREIAAVSLDVETRLDCLVMGIRDLAKAARTKVTAGREPMRLWLMQCVAAARAYGLDVLDAVYNEISDLEGLREQSAEARDMGFDGKTIIHPHQIDVCNAIFAPTPDEVAQARSIVAAFDGPAGKGKEVLAINGRLLERLHLSMARRTITIAEALADLEPFRRTDPLSKLA